MPELPEVETYRRYFSLTSLNQTVKEVEILDATILRCPNLEDFVKKIKCSTFIKTTRIGKYLFVHLYPRGVLLLHFGMTGDIRYNRREELPNLAPIITRHDRIRFYFDSNGVLSIISQRKFARIEWWPSVQDCINIRKLGKDALEIELNEFIEVIQSSTRAIKAILLDQHRISGLGNLYADELLFQTQISPLSSGNQLFTSQIEKLWKKMRKILKIAVDLAADYGKFPENFFLFSRKIEGVCPRCNTKLEKTIIGQRTTIFCPKCQHR
ncbi:MAG: Fpg/Nei family DNA glycosylase [Promethearchaeota archaeon]